MKEYVNLHRFRDGFVQMDRRNSFSYEGLELLFNFLEDLEEQLGTEFEYDPIELCCSYKEFKNIKAFQYEYGEKFQTLEDIDQETTIISENWNPDELFIIEAF